MHIENDVSVIGGEITQSGLPPQLDQLACHITARHRQHLHRQRKLAQHRHKLGRIADADKLVCHCRDDFFACQRATAAFDHVKMLGDFICAIHVNPNLAGTDTVEIQHTNAVVAQALCRRLGTRHRAVDLVLYFGQLVDEQVGGGAGADTDDAAFDIGCRSLRDLLFEFVLSCHAYTFQLYAIIVHNP
ncbi:hypothetical protein GALL_296280 [mine drainage metagenome]|uniref:Uncharacterized protein n=1 Tax=mine drainage metagenome TaxID=410659 RepID=A0A1J5QXS2_9ZZZZ